MAIEHKNIAEANLHEPKGVSVASVGQVYVADGAGTGNWVKPEPKGADAASAGQVYVADGAGSGSFAHKTGFQYVTDNVYTSGAKRAIATGVRTKITINKATDVNENLSIWNSTTNKLETEGLNYCYHIRLAFKASTAATSPYIDMEYDIGGGVGVILSKTETLVKGGGTTNKIVHSSEVFTGSTFVTNGMEIYITPSGNVDFWDFELFLVRSHRANAG